MNTVQKRARILELHAEIHRLQAEIAQEERRCRHTRWSNPEYDPIVTPHLEFSHYEGCGSDPNPVYRRAGNNEKPRWKRVCLDCGKVEYTEKRKTVQTAPDFS